MAIFVNYRRADSQAITGRIDDHLRAAFGDPDVYRDVDNIPYGEDFVEQLQNALKQCDVCVAVLGPHWASERLNERDDYVRMELEAVLARRIPVYPVLVDGALMPKPAQIPESLHPLLRRNALEIDSGADFKAHVGKLVSAIKARRERRAAELAQAEAARVEVARVEVARVAAKPAVEAEVARVGEAPMAGVDRERTTGTSAALAQPLPDTSVQREKDAVEAVKKKKRAKRARAAPTPLAPEVKAVSAAATEQSLSVKSGLTVSSIVIVLGLVIRAFLPSPCGSAAPKAANTSTLPSVPVPESLVAHAAASANRRLLSARPGSSSGSTASAEQGIVWNVPIEGDDPMRGPAGALVTVVEIADFAGLFSASAAILKQAVAAYPNDLRVVWKPWFSSLDRRAEPAAVFARYVFKVKGAAAFWQVHDQLFANPGQLAETDFQKLAAGVGLDWNENTNLFARPPMVEKHERSVKLADALAQVVLAQAKTETGSRAVARGAMVFVNGVFWSGPLSFETFKALIDRRLLDAHARLARGVGREAIYSDVLSTAKNP